MTIHLHIERVVLDGLVVGAAQAPQIAAAIQKELARLLAAGGLAPHARRGGAIPRLRGGNIRPANQSSPAALGRQIAGAVYQGINRK
jgi:hypothetical protein